MGPTVIGAEITGVYTVAQLGNIKFRLGHIYFDEMGNPHVFVKYDQGSGSVAGTAGLFVCQQDITYQPFVVTADLDDADALVDLPAGQLRATLAHDEYGFAQCGGLNRIVITTDGTITRNGIGVLTTGDGTISEWASGLRVRCGVARADDSGNDLAIGAFMIDCPRPTM